MVDAAPKVAVFEEAPFELRRPDWQARANCHPDVIPPVWQPFGRSPVDLFYPATGNNHVTAARRAAIASVCGPCPVREECRTHAIQHEKEGFWGELGSVTLDDTRRDNGIRLVTPEVDPKSNKTIGTFIPPSHGTESRYQQHLHAPAGTDPPCELCKEAHRIATAAQKSAQWAERKRNETPEQREARLAANRVRGMAGRVARRRHG